MSKRISKHLYWKVPFLLFLIIGTVVILRQNQTMPYQTDEGEIFGTFYHITYQHDRKLSDEIRKVLQDVDMAMSPFNKSSIITKVNNNEDIKLNDIFIDVFTLSQRISAETAGAFDITVAPLVNAWGFGFRNDISPTTSALDSIRSFIGYEKVSINHGRVKKDDNRIMLDCSAIAKGYACDAVAKLLRNHDVRNFMVEIGGEVITQGQNSKHNDWRIGVAVPTEETSSDAETLQTILKVSNCAMATSGNYRNFYYKDGKRYAHTIDLKTCLPVQHSLLSATVLAPSCAMADAYATAFMVMGVEKAKDILNKHSELLAYFIYSNSNGEYEVWHSEKINKMIADD